MMKQVLRKIGTGVAFVLMATVIIFLLLITSNISKKNSKEIWTPLHSEYSYKQIIIAEKSGHIYMFEYDGTHNGVPVRGIIMRSGLQYVLRPVYEGKIFLTLIEYRAEVVEYQSSDVE